MEKQVFQERAAGVLLHISSLPGAYGIGSLGKKAYEFVDRLVRCGVRYWQVLPLVQTGYGDSPYQSVYSGSGNPYFIDLEQLAQEKLLKKTELSFCRYKGGSVDYTWLYQTRYKVLRLAFSRFDTRREDFVSFVREGRFEGYALFQALKEKFDGASFDRWPREYKFAQARALTSFRAEHEKEVLFWLFVQFMFFRQWKKLKAYANERGVYFIGDIPLYVAYDSVDVWLNPRLFKLNPDLSMKKVAGVPPDYFSETGQLWGNPVYRWNVHKKENYAWWTERFRQAFDLYDVVRADHFRGFDRYYEIDAGAKTAVHGVWKAGPKKELFEAAEQKLGRLNLIAEDLGTLDRGVYRLMAETGYPGMKVLEFAFDGNRRNPHLPKNISENCVCYTGTHDNDTLYGYIKGLQGEELRLFRRELSRVLKTEGEPPARGAAAQTDAIVRLALKSKARLAVIPVQDLLRLDSRSRMNVPSTSGDNWKFRLKSTVSDQVLSVLKRQPSEKPM